MESPFVFRGADFVYFEEPVPYYSLYRTSRKLNSYFEVCYVGEVLLHLNPKLTYSKFKELMSYLTDRTNSHVVRTYSESKVDKLCKYVFNNRKTPYVRRYRRLVFNPVKFISKEDKRYIIGTVMGSRSKVNEETIYDAIEELMMTESRITIDMISDRLECSRQTVSKKMTSNLKDIIQDYNRKVKLEESKSDIINIVNDLTEGSYEKIIMLRKLLKTSKTSVNGVLSTFFDN